MDVLNGRRRFAVLMLLAVLAVGLGGRGVQAKTLLKNICRVKGQEENKLQGLGLVIGLKGTGDSGKYLPTMRVLARSMELMGNPLGVLENRRGGGLLELKDTKNVALVMVEATIPPTGARQGDKIDCEVSAISAKSLLGGRLVFAALQGPNVNDHRVYAVASGRVHLDDAETPTTGSIHKGCRLEEDFFNAYQKDGTVTLVLNHNHADFDVATQVADEISATLLRERPASYSANVDYLAQAIDPTNIVVSIPMADRADPVPFIAGILNLPIYDPRTEARVDINERTGSIVISGDVEIGAVVVSHKNVVVETGEVTPARFTSLDPSRPDSPKLDALVKALEALQVPTVDVIEIIKGIDRNGKLHGQLNIR